MIRVLATITILITIFLLLGWYEVVVWKECLKTDPWWYCLRVLAK